MVSSFFFSWHARALLLLWLRGRNPPCFPLHCSVATETEKWNDMNVENNHTAEEKEQPKNGSETITIHAALGDEGLSYCQRNQVPNVYLLLRLGLANFPRRESLLAALAAFVQVSSADSRRSFPTFSKSTSALQHKQIIESPANVDTGVCLCFQMMYTSADAVSPSSQHLRLSSNTSCSSAANVRRHARLTVMLAKRY